MTPDEEDTDITSSVLHWNYRNLKRFPPCLLEHSDKLKDIYLKENRISRVPEEIGRLERLESLHLSGNDIACVPREIGRLRRLRYLDLSGNLLVALPDEFGELLTLRALVLDDNQLTALPLRLADLPQLRYLSVYDNRLSWLPQRPVHNPRHCELRVWRNPTLRCLPYNLWFHMFREQRVPCFSIGYGCLGVGGGDVRNGSILKMQSETSEWKIEMSPAEAAGLVGYRSVRSPHEPLASPAPLSELCLRLVYRILSERAADNRRSLCADPYSYSQFWISRHLHCDRSQRAHTASETIDENNNTCTEIPSNSFTDSTDLTELCPCSCASEVTTSQLLERHLNCLPPSIKRDLQNGPVSMCENIACKTPVFDYAYLHFYMGSLELLDSSQPVLLSGAFCSRRCASALLPAAPILLSWRWNHDIS